MLTFCILVYMAVGLLLASYWSSKDYIKIYNPIGFLIVPFITPIIGFVLVVMFLLAVLLGDFRHEQ